MSEYYQLPNESYTDAVIRTHATYAEAYACGHEIMLKPAYCDRPDASGMDMKPNRMIIDVFLMDVMINQPRWTEVDVTYYNAEQLQDLIGSSNRTLKRYTPCHTGNYRARFEALCIHMWRYTVGKNGRNKAMRMMLENPAWENA